MNRRDVVIKQKNHNQNNMSSLYCSGAVDDIPILSQLKSLGQLMHGDFRGAHTTQDMKRGDCRFLSSFPCRGHERRCQCGT